MKKRIELKKETVSVLNNVRGGEAVVSVDIACWSKRCSNISCQGCDVPPVISLTVGTCETPPVSAGCVTQNGVTCLGGQGCIVSAQCDSTFQAC